MPDPVLVVPPAPSAVTSAQVKGLLRIDHDLDDALIAARIAEAVQELDGWNGRLGFCIAPQTWELQLDAFRPGAIRLPLGPVSSVVSVIYADPTGTEQTLDPSAWTLDAQGVGGWIVPVDGWPQTMATINAVRVRWVAGPARSDVLTKINGIIRDMAAAAYAPHDDTIFREFDQRIAAITHSPFAAA
jgi:uncharacterized phiE125 gp8 family phage protein